MSLTPRQLETLTYIRDYRYKHGIAPTYQEMADFTGTSKTAVLGKLRELERKGAVTIDARRARSAQITDDGMKLVGAVKPVRLCWPIKGTIGGVN